MLKFKIDKWRKSMEKFFDYITDALLRCKIVTDAETGKIDLFTLYANDRVESIINVSKEELLNRNLTQAIPELRESIFDWPKIISEAAMTDDNKVIEQYVVAFDKYIRFNTFGYKDGCFDLIITDLTETRSIKRSLLERDRQIAHLENQMKETANIDMLTKLYNFQFVMDSICSSVGIYNDYEVKFCVLIVDVDDFKKINQLYGTEIGDEVLQSLAVTIGSVVRKIDVVGRYGNDKFIILFNNVDMEISKIMVERLKHEIHRHPMKLDDLKISVSGALLEYNGEGKFEFIKNAEEKMTKAKSMGKGTIIS
jgi:diguanylate cyclase (GGDEF)-like protein